MCARLAPLCEMGFLWAMLLWGLAVAAAMGGLLALPAGRGGLARVLIAAALAGLGLLAILASRWEARLLWGGAAALFLALWPLSQLWRREARQGRRLFLAGAAGALGLAGLGSLAAERVWRGLLTERQRTLVERRRRPRDPWPRGHGAVLIGGFGAGEREKIYLEPGGSLSPAVGSFGASFWVIGRDGRVEATSDDLPLGSLRHRYEVDGAGFPSLRVEAPPYEARWRLGAEGGVTLDILRGPVEGRSLELVFRSVGPAGGPLRHIRADAMRRLVILDGEWTVVLPEHARLRRLGDERRGRLTAPGEAAAEAVSSAEGWAFARVALPAGARVELRRRRPRPVAPLPGSEALLLEGLPEPFTARLRAQVTTLLLGLVGDETRPGDPMNYPLAWQRDAAYVIVALARAGHAATARRLCRQIAEEDFFGGFGAEADAPGLALWTLGEVSTAVADPAFDAALWPHLVRKVALIAEMRTARGEVRHRFTGPAVPAYARRRDLDVVAEATRDGLIVGRMDWHQPLFYVNGVSVLGLREAARLAARIGREEEARAWGAACEELTAAWRAALRRHGPASPEALNPRTAIIGLWPAEVAEPEPYRAVLEARWAATRSPDGRDFLAFPPWTYFDLAEAHQWLRLGRPDRVHATLDWFDRHQPTPGLHTFWEGTGEENSFRQWRHVRGNLAPRGVMPHYWSAAECLLLSLSMLAYSVPGPPARVVIGAGLLPAWLAQPIAVRGVGTAAGPVAWRWDPAGLLAVAAPPSLAVEPGPAFPPATRIERLAPA